MKQNLVSYAFTEESFNDLKLKLNEVGEKIAEFALELHITDRHTLQSMGNHSIPFTDYAYMMAVQRKDLVPSYLDMEEFNRDINLFKQARELLQMVEIIRERLIDTSTAAGADAFTAARKFYTAVKAGVKSEIPGATVIHEEMKKRFLKMKNKSESPGETPPPEEKPVNGSEAKAIEAKQPE